MFLTVEGRNGWPPSCNHLSSLVFCYGIGLLGYWVMDRSAICLDISVIPSKQPMCRRGLWVLRACSGQQSLSVDRF